MTNPTIRKLRVPVYQTPLWIVIHSSISKAIEYIEDRTDCKILEEKKRKGVKAFVFGYEDDAGAKKFMLFIRPTAKPGEIAHEVKHLVNLIFHWHGARLSITNDENECYYLEDLVDKVHNTLALYKRKNKKVTKVLADTKDLTTFTT